jgi:hypothetical protein
MEAKFKKGDVVEAVMSTMSGYITKGRRYIVSECGARKCSFVGHGKRKFNIEGFKLADEREQPFKVGDRVRRINPANDYSYGPKAGDEYIVASIPSSMRITLGGFSSLMDFWVGNFELVDHPNEEKIIFHKGDEVTLIDEFKKLSRFGEVFVVSDVTEYPEVGQAIFLKGVIGSIGHKASNFRLIRRKPAEVKLTNVKLKPNHPWYHIQVQLEEEAA